MSKWIWLIVLGALLAVAGAVTTVVYFFQPWRSCPYDDASDACPMLPVDATIMFVAFAATVIGLGILVAGIVLQYMLGSSPKSHAQ